MRLRSWLLALLLPLCVVSPDAADEPKGSEGPVVSWKKTVIEPKFRSEGVAIADVNRDGRMDILAGEVWYEAPEWKRHEIKKAPRDYGDGLAGYSESFCCWADDLNHDGWPDLIVIRFPGAPCYWYENPKGQPGHWKEYLIWHSACNETPQYADLFGTGHRVLIMGVQPAGKEREGQMAWFAPGRDPTQPWGMHPISEPSLPERQAPGVLQFGDAQLTYTLKVRGLEIPGTFRFSHGLGVGDVNGDGRQDVICTGGWWEQPAKQEGKPWKFHPANLGEACADMFAYDIDGDGKADILSTSAHRYGIWCHLQRPGKDGEPTFLRTDLFKELVSETHALHLVDINGDGVKDLVTGKRWWSHGRNEPGADKPAMLYWFEAKRGKDGMTRFVPQQIDDASGIGTQFVVADFNGDKLPDVVTSNKRGTFLFEQGRTTPKAAPDAGR
jgi:hypothetical protein